MHNSEFFRRFVDAHEIGRDMTDTHLSVFYDNGREVGLWRHDRRSTVGVGSVLSPDDAEMARNWFNRLHREDTSRGDRAEAPDGVADRVLRLRDKSSAGKSR